MPVAINLVGSTHGKSLYRVCTVGSYSAQTLNQYKSRAYIYLSGESSHVKMVRQIFIASYDSATLKEAIDFWHFSFRARAKDNIVLCNNYIINMHIVAG